MSSFSFAALAAFPNTHYNTGYARTDIIGVAETQIGYAEASDGSTIYGKFFNAPKADWSAAFVSWCASQAEISADIVPSSVSLSVFREFYDDISCYYRSGAYGGGYTPFKGDIAFFSNTGSLVSITGIGIVSDVNSEKVYVIEGDKDNKVQRTAYSLTDKTLVGYACPQYPSADDGGYYKANTALNLRAQGTAASDLLTVIPVGTTVYVTRMSGSWGATVYAGKSGWVNTDFCTYLPSSSVGQTENSGKSLYLVADMSKWNEASKIKWDQFIPNGVEGVILRIGGRGYGAAKSLYKDTSFLAHYGEAKKAGLHVGVYFFSYALTKTQALEEAELTISILQSNNIELDMPVFIDIEDYVESDGYDLQHYKAGKAVCSMVANTFCDKIKEAGYYPGVYCNKSFAETLLEPSVFTDRAVWIAQYGVSKCTYSGELDMWQYTKAGKLSAFSGNLDLSYCYTDFPSLINPVPAPTGSYTEHVAADEWTVTSAPSCAAQGESVKKCVDCGKVIITEVLPENHVASEENVLLLNTSVNALDTLSSSLLNTLHSSKASGYSTYYNSYNLVGGTLLTYCTVCKKVLSVKYSFPNEQHGNTKTATTAATCISEGKTVVSCADCGKKLSETALQKTVHTDGASALNKTTCTEDGTKSTVCAVCSMSYKTEAVSATAHSYKNIVTVSKTTLTSDGKKKYTCVSCSSSFIENIAAPVYCDTDVDGTVTVADARAALRASVGLDKLPEISIIASDADNSGSITGADARLILRIAVNLDNPETVRKIYYKN